MLAVVSSQAFFVTERQAPPGLADLLALSRRHVRPVTASRVLAGELAELAEAFRSRVFDVAPGLADPFMPAA